MDRSVSVTGGGDEGGVLGETGVPAHHDATRRTLAAAPPPPEVAAPSDALDAVTGVGEVPFDNGAEGGVLDQVSAEWTTAGEASCEPIPIRRSDLSGTHDSWLASVQRSLSAAVVSASTDGRIRSWNEGAEALLGYRADEVLGRPVTMLAAPEDRLATVRLLARTFRGEPVPPFESWRQRKDGSAVRVSILLSPVRDRVGRVVGACGVLREVGGGGWLQAEIDALTSEVDVVVGVFDDQLRPLSASESLTRVFGLEREEWLSEDAQAAVERVHPDDLELVSSTFGRWMSSPGLSSAPVRYRIRHADGTWRWVECFAHNLLDDPDVRGLVVTTWDITDRQVEHEARTEAESRIRAMFDQAVIPQALFDLDRRIIDINPALGRVLGYDKDELIGRYADEFVHPEDRDMGRPAFARLLAGEVESVDYERRYRRKDGTYVEMRTRTALVRDGEGHPLYAAAIGSDVTERNAALRAQEQSEARLRAITEASADVVIVLDDRRRALFVSPPIRTLLGYEPEELVGTDAIEFVHSDDRPAALLQLAEAFRASPEQGKNPFGFRARAADGTWRHVEAISTNLLEDPAVGGVLLNVRDVSERQQAQEALARSETLYRTIVETAQEGIWQVDRDNRIVFANPALATLLGCQVQDLVGMRPLELLGPEHRAAHSSTSAGPFMAQPAEEFRFLTWHGSEVWATISTSHVRNGDGDVVGAVAMVTDITERRKADTALRDSEQRFRSLVQYASDLAIIAGPDGTITYVTPAAEEFLGQSAEGVAGLNIFDWINEEDLSHVSDSLTEVLADRRPIGRRVPAVIRCRARHGDGTWHRVEATLSNLLDVPAVAGIVVNVRDIDEVTVATELMEVSQRRFESLVQHATDVIVVVDAGGIVTYVSPSLEQVLGYRPHELLGRRTRQLVLEEDHPVVEDLMYRLTRRHEPAAKAEIRARNGAGEYVRIELVGTNLLDDPAVAGMVFNLRDVSERVRSETELQVRAAQQAAVGRLGQRALAAPELQQLFEESVHTLADTLGVEISAVVESLPDGGELLIRAIAGVPAGMAGTVWAEPDGDGQAALTLAADEPVLVDSLADETRFTPHPDLLAAGVVSCASVLIPGPRGPFGVLLVHSRQHRHFTVDDVNFLAAVANVLGSAVQRRTYEQRLTYQATYDILTGLPNRALLLDRLRLALSRRTPGRIVGVLFIGLDRFKMVNDAYSHELGDEVLAAVGDRMWAHVRPADTVARFGGDEFTILCDDLTREEEAVELAERILETLSRPFELSGERINLTASIGICLATGQQDAETMLAEADAAMVEAKSHGHGRWELFDVSFRHRIMARLQLESDLRSAVDNDELILHYQPLVRLDTGEITGVECLLRWDHPVRGHTLPSQFVQVAEETGTIVPIGAWTIDAACAQAVAWRDTGRGRALSVSVNLSARQLDEPETPNVIAKALERHRLEPQLLCLEITESVLMRDASQALETLETLKDLGVRIAIDDFGTGYSSLAYLRRFPVDVLKIDGSFVQGLGEDPEDSAIVAAVLRLAETLGVDVVAEGIETAGQLDTLRALGCQFGQGYYFSQPVPADQL
jgi:diguanylate cyclase (GGDEF)-like protein/PAS domain S-box-containing protein